MRIVNTKGNESVLPWYKGEGREKEKVSVHRVIKTYVQRQPDQNLRTQTLSSLSLSIM